MFRLIREVNGALGCVVILLAPLWFIINGLDFKLLSEGFGLARLCGGLLSAALRTEISFSKAKL